MNQQINYFAFRSDCDDIAVVLFDVFGAMKWVPRYTSGDKLLFEPIDSQEKLADVIWNKEGSLIPAGVPMPRIRSTRSKHGHEVEPDSTTLLEVSPCSNKGQTNTAYWGRLRLLGDDPATSKSFELARLRLDAIAVRFPIDDRFLVFKYAKNSAIQFQLFPSWSPLSSPFRTN
jgi:hypothetical protein